MATLPPKTNGMATCYQNTTQLLFCRIYNLNTLCVLVVRVCVLTFSNHVYNFFQIATEADDGVFHDNDDLSHRRHRRRHHHRRHRTDEDGHEQRRHHRRHHHGDGDRDRERRRRRRHRRPTGIGPNTYLIVGGELQDRFIRRLQRWTDTQTDVMRFQPA